MSAFAQTLTPLSTAEAQPQTALPTVVGYHLLIRPWVRKQKGLIALPQRDAEVHGVATIVGQVVGMGADAYTGSKFQNGAWCKLNDWVIFQAYTGTRLKVHGDEGEYRIVNDDQINAVVADPELIERAY